MELLGASHDLTYAKHWENWHLIIVFFFFLRAEVNLILEKNGTSGWMPSGFTYHVILLSTCQYFPTSDEEFSNQSDRAFFPRINTNYFREECCLAQFRSWAHSCTSHFAGGALWLAWPRFPVYTCCLSIVTNSARSTL